MLCSLRISGPVELDVRPLGNLIFIHHEEMVENASLHTSRATNCRCPRNGSCPMSHSGDGLEHNDTQHRHDTPCGKVEVVQCC